ncbi:MAG: hypothetical protein HY537_07420 [Deltaproteobacteria bacterium]|nr:hypothetical protein [Deltaproteobacteria bacterium]
MNIHIKKGMVFCAGLGTRLLPLTENIPKPLVPILNISNVLYALFLLKEAGIEQAIINLHHLGDEVRSFLGNGNRFGVKLSYSEEKTLLGTGGGLKKAEAFFESHPFVLLNCDFISNVQLLPIIDKHIHRNALATMVLCENKAIQSAYSEVGIDPSGHLCKIADHQHSDPVRIGIFTGIHILSPEIFSYLREVPSSIVRSFYSPAMSESPNRFWGEFLTKEYWYDTGDLYSLWGSTMSLFERLSEQDRFLSRLLTFHGYKEKKPATWSKGNQPLPPLNSPMVVGENCSVGTGAYLARTVLGENTTVCPRSRIENSVVFPHSKVETKSYCNSILWGSSVIQLDPKKLIE